MFDGCRQKLEEESKAVGDDRRDVGSALRDRVTAIELPAKRKIRRPDSGQGCALYRRRAHDRGQYLELREMDPVGTAEEARPRPACQNDGAACDAPLFGDHRADGPAGGFNTPNRARSENVRAKAARRFGDRGRRD